MPSHIFEFLFSSSILVNESEHNGSSLLHHEIGSCSNRVTHISIVSPQPLKPRSVHNRAQLGCVESFGGCTGVDPQLKKWKGVQRWTGKVKLISLEIYMMHDAIHDPSMCWSQVPVHLEAASLEGFGDCVHCPVWSGRHGPQCGMYRF